MTKLHFIRKPFAILLVIALMSTIMGFINAQASISKVPVSYPISFYVPETIYLTPAQSTTTSTFNYYVDCETNGSLIADNADTAGKLYFYCAGATACSITCLGAAVMMGETTGTDTINTNITGGTIVTPLSPGETSLLTWTVTYTVNGDTRTAKAYSLCYAPQINEVAAGIRQVHTYSTDVFNQGVLWLIGLHSLTGGTHICNRNFFYDAAPSSDTGTAGWYTSFSGGGVGFNDDEHSSNASDDESATGGTGYIIVDSSRYTNLNQIPNLMLGFWQCDCEGDSTINGWIKQTADSTETQLLSMADYGIGCIYSSPISYASTLGYLGSRHFEFSTFTANNRGYRYNNNYYYIDLSITYVNKADLRSQIRTCIQAGLQQSDYTSLSWTVYLNALSAAAAVLGNPTSLDVSTTATALSNAFSSLTKTTNSVSITHLLPCPVGATGLINGISKADSADGLTDGYLTVTESLTFNSSDTVSFSPNSYTGYTVVSASGSTTSITAQSWPNSRNDINVVYLYSPNQYTVTLDYGTDPAGGYGHQLYTSTYNVSSITVRFNYTYASGNLPLPTMTGWSFGGWYTSPSFSSRVHGSNIMTLPNSHTIYAKWAPYFSGGHGLKAGNTINGTVINYDDMFIISNAIDFDRIDQYDNTFSYLTSNGLSFKQTTDITIN